METCPTEIWHEIFALACTDTGLTGRSLSLVSKHFHDISGPFKYQSLAITRWRQLIAFSQTFSQLPDFQKKIRYLFIHGPYPFLDVEDNPRLASERPCLGIYFENPSVDEDDLITDEEDSDSDSDYSVSESGSDLDNDWVTSEFGGSLDSDEEQDVKEDLEYLYDKSLSNEGDTREDESLDYDIEAVFYKAIEALRAILHETSSTLNILTLYWTSFRPLEIDDILPPLPFLDELHLYRCSVAEGPGPVFDDPWTTALFPRLRLLFMSGDAHNRSLSRSVARVAPNLTHLRYTRVTAPYGLQSPYGLRRCIGDIVVKTTKEWATDQIQTLVSGEVSKSESSIPIMGYIGELPESWQFLWSSRIAGQLEAWNAQQDG